jgi:hypothetical protein
MKRKNKGHLLSELAIAAAVATTGVGLAAREAVEYSAAGDRITAQVQQASDGYVAYAERCAAIAGVSSQ